MCNIPAKSWVKYVQTLWFWFWFMVTDNTAYQAFSWDVAIYRLIKLYFNLRLDYVTVLLFDMYLLVQIFFQTEINSITVLAKVGWRFCFKKVHVMLVQRYLSYLAPPRNLGGFL